MRTLLTIAILFFATSTASVQADLVFADDFSGVADGALNGVAGWDAQNAWTVSGGMATMSGNWERGRRTAGFRTEIGEGFKISLSNLSITGTGNGTQDIFQVGVAKSDETAGQNTPQLGTGIKLDGSNLNIAGAVDTGYDSGDSIDLMLTLTRLGSDSWAMETMITNTTDSTSFSSSNGPMNGVGNAANPITVGAWFDAAATNEAFFGIRGFNNANGATISVGGIQLDTIAAVPEPGSVVMFSVALGIMFRRRRS